MLKYKYDKRKIAVNFYHDLELDSLCSFEEIRKQYRILAQKYHPDKGGDEDRFKRIKLAYEVLSDPDRRKEYDSTGKFNEDFTIRSEALSRLNNMINQYVPTLNSETEDLLFKMRMDLKKTMEDTQLEVDRTQTGINNSRQCFDRLWLKTTGEKLLHDFIQITIKNYEGRLQHNIRQMSVLNLMTEILEDYHFGPNEWRPLLKDERDDL
jgi:curved DNA-binding protein CbpA